MQLSAIPQVRELAALMQAHGVTRCVLCPGSRNSPVVRTLTALPAFTCRAVTDERSAGFIALGWANQAQAPVAVCVTSGSALLNLHPAVAEAYYCHLPLLIISADRPAAWIGQQAGQTLPQPGAFGSLTPCSVQLPGSMDTTLDAWHTNRLINEALLALRRGAGSPAHINIPLREPLCEMEEGELPHARVIDRLDLSQASSAHELTALISTSTRRLLLLGQLSDPPIWATELAAQGWAIAGEHLSQAQGIAQTCPDLLLGSTPAKEWAPELLLTYGGHLISKRLKQLLLTHPPKLHLHLSEGGELIDTFCCLTHCLQGTPQQLIRALANSPEASPQTQAYAARWASPLPQPSRGKRPWSGVRAVGELMAHLQPGNTLHLANSSAVRYAQLFSLPPGIHIRCNRGVNGIEGCLSSAIGHALADPDHLHYLIIGDLAFFYDMNALGILGITPNLRILLLNNHTGGIFATLPGQAHAMVAGEGKTTAQGWAQACGFHYASVQEERDWAQALATLTSTTAGHPILVEILCDATTDAALLPTYLSLPSPS